jgi:hypothetical protein
MALLHISSKPAGVLVQVVVSVGVGIASYGELNFVAIGVMLQLISVATESVRLSLVQILLQARPLPPQMPPQLHVTSALCRMG